MMQRDQWIIFKNLFKSFYPPRVNELKKFLDSQLEQVLDYDLYFYLFYIPFVRMTFNRYSKGLPLDANDISSNTNHRKLKPKQYNIPELTLAQETDKQILFWRFFHRHNAHEQKFKNYYQNISAEPLKLIKKPPTVTTLSYMLENILSCNLDNSIVERALLLIKNKKFIQEFQAPHMILTSAHAIQNSSENLLLMLLTRQLGGKLVIIQPSFFHNIAKFYEQDELEHSIADFYLAWSDYIKPGKHSEKFGSFYAARSSNKHSIDCAVLPPIPKHQGPRAQSKYFGMSLPDYLKSNSLAALVSRLKFLEQEKKGRLIARAKSTCQEFYQKLFIEKNINIPLHVSNVNQYDDFETYDNTFVMYFGTAIPEAHFKGSNLYIGFDKEDVMLEDTPQKDFTEALSKSDLNGFYKLDCSFIDKYCIPIHPNEALDFLSHLIDKAIH